MREDVYLRHIENNKNHWWFEGRKELIKTILKRNIKKKKIEILDFGAGSGVNIKMLSDFGNVYAFEPHKVTQNYLKKKFKKKNIKIVKSFSKKKFDLIVLADVLEHLKKDNKEIIRLSGKLKNKGKFLITVPAFKILFTNKDAILGHYRRYNIKNLFKIFKNFKVLKISYFNFFLFIPISFLLIVFKLINYDFIKKVEKKPNVLINYLLSFIFLLESKLINFINFPFGISIIGLFEKNDK